MTQFMMILMHVYLEGPDMSMHWEGEGMDRNPPVFMHPGEVLQNTGKNSVWAMECGNTTQSAAINEGMQG